MQDLTAEAPQEQNLQGYTQEELQTRDLFLGKLKLSSDFEKTLNFTERENTSREYKKEAEFEVKKGETFSYRYTYLGKDYQGEFSAVSEEIDYNTQDTLNAKFLHNGLRMERVETGINADGESVYKIKLQIPESFTGAVHIKTDSKEGVVFSDIDYIEPKAQIVEREPEVILENDAGEIESLSVAEQAEELAISSPSDLKIDIPPSLDLADFEFDTSPNLDDIHNDSALSYEASPESDLKKTSEPKISSESKIKENFGDEASPIPEKKVKKEEDISKHSEITQDLDFEVTPESVVTKEDFQTASEKLLNYFSEYNANRNIVGSDNQIIPVVSAFHLDDFRNLGNNPVSGLIKSIPAKDVSLFQSITLASGDTSYLVLDAESETFSMFNKEALVNSIQKNIYNNISRNMNVKKIRANSPGDYIPRPFSAFGETKSKKMFTGANKQKTNLTINPYKLKENDITAYINAYTNYNSEQNLVIINNFAVIRDKQGRLLLQSVTDMNASDERFILFDPKAIEGSINISEKNANSPKSEKIKTSLQSDLYSDPLRDSGTNSFYQAI